jgi:hypothetical protein
MVRRRGRRQPPGPTPRSCARLRPRQPRPCVKEALHRRAQWGVPRALRVLSSGVVVPTHLARHGAKGARRTRPNPSNPTLRPLTRPQPRRPRLPRPRPPCPCLVRMGGGVGVGGCGWWAGGRGRGRGWGGTSASQRGPQSLRPAPFGPSHRHGAQCGRCRPPCGHAACPVGRQLSFLPSARTHRPSRRRSGAWTAAARLGWRDGSPAATRSASTSKPSRRGARQLRKRGTSQAQRSSQTVSVFQVSCFRVLQK